VRLERSDFHVVHVIETWLDAAAAAKESWSAPRSLCAQACPSQYRYARDGRRLAALTARARS
jgi:hypothetical protein